MLYLNTHHLRRCIETLGYSLTLYQQASKGEIQQEVYRNAIVKGFELTQEVAFKLLRKALKAFGHSGKKLETLFVKDLIRLATNHGLMGLDEAERWFKYRDNRNDTAHDYGISFAEETLALISPFLIDVTALADVLEQKFGAEGGQDDKTSPDPQ
jgi:nucleotidyltransferase substrate binding protein (TIGR01987 family)